MREREGGVGCHRASGAEAFFELAWEGGCRALAALGVMPGRLYDIGGFRVRMRAGGPMVGHLLGAFGHLEISPAESRDLDILAWDSVSSGVPMPSPPWGRDDYGQRGEIRGFNDARFMAAFDQVGGALNLLDRASGRAIFWTRDGARLPEHERGAPFRAILNGWLGGRGCALAHGAAVGAGGGAVLLAGMGGSGKSTTALICVGGGMSFLGDDYCLLRADPSPEVSSVYGTAKVAPADLARMPGLAGRAAVDPRVPGKALIFLADALPGCFARRLPLRAVLLPVVAGGRETSLRAADAAEALRALAPSSIFQVSGSGGGTFDLLAGLVRALPCYHLALGTDFSRIGEVVRGVLSGVSGR